MLVLKKKYDKLKEDYNWLVDTKNYWEEVYRESQSKVVRLENQCNKCYKALDKADDELLDLKLERDMYKERNKELWDKFIAIHSELQTVDRIVLQYEQRINLLDGEIEELKKYMEESKEYE